MLDRDHHIVMAALSVFSRYGVSKTTMNDIAAEAGVSRQTLYNAFPGKTELLRAAVRLTMQETLDDIRGGLGRTTDLGARIDSYFAAGPIAWFDAVTTSPELAEILDGMHAVASEELAEGKTRLGRVLRAVIRRGRTGQAASATYRCTMSRSFSTRRQQDGEGCNASAGRPDGAPEGHPQAVDRADGTGLEAGRDGRAAAPPVVQPAVWTARFAITFTRFAR
jgi:AcrR family transcriptional regulator